MPCGVRPPLIDTSIHHYAWSRSQAIDYLASHAALSQHEVETDVDRYISWPGQALSYMLGELEIRHVRAQAEPQLGMRFDIRKFHAMLLGLGSVPLPVLEDQIQQFIAASRASPGTASSVATAPAQQRLAAVGKTSAPPSKVAFVHAGSNSKAAFECPAEHVRAFESDRQADALDGLVGSAESFACSLEP